MLDIIKSNFGFVRTLANIKNMTNVSVWKVSQVFAILIIVLIVQLKLTKQNRKLIVNVVRITLGITTSLGLLGSAGILLYKMINYKRKRDSELRRLE